MSVCKSHTHLRKSIKIWRLGLFVSAKMADPMIEIIDCDEEYIRLLGLCGKCNSQWVKAAQRVKAAQ